MRAGAPSRGARHGAEHERDDVGPAGPQPVARPHGPTLAESRARGPDTVDVDLDVTDKFPLHGSLELNNRYNADTTSTRLAASLSYDNFFQRGDSGTLSYQVAPENVRDAEVTSASYLFHIPD